MKYLYLYRVGWYRGEKRSMRSIRSTKHLTNATKNRLIIVKMQNSSNPNLALSSAPISHNPQLPTPEDRKKSDQSSSSKSSQLPPKPIFFNSVRFNGLIRDLNLPKRKSEHLGSSLNQRNLLGI